MKYYNSVRYYNYIYFKSITATSTKFNYPLNPFLVFDAFASDHNKVLPIQQELFTYDCKRNMTINSISLQTVRYARPSAVL